MSRKTEEAYTHAFEYIDKNVFSLRGASFMVDFELAMRNGIAKIWIDILINTCWFHFCQACQRRVSKDFALAKLIKTNDEARLLYKKLLALPLLPAELILDAFYKIKVQALSSFPVAFRRILGYYDRQWIQRVMFK